MAVVWHEVGCVGVGAGEPDAWDVDFGSADGADEGGAGCGYCGVEWVVFGSCFAVAAYGVE